MTDGFLLIDKQVGPTSHDIVRTVRQRLKTKRVGHAGTLDPFASGLLIVLLNKATRLFDYLSDVEKFYTGVIKLGERTDTDDCTGQVVETSDVWKNIGESDITTAMQTLAGAQLQTPPAYSAKKVQGQPAYQRARRGESVVLAPSAVHVSAFEVVSIIGPLVHFRAAVSTGTYVRALARDLGDKLGCGGHLTELRRTAIGAFSASDAIAAVDASWDHVLDPGLLVGHLTPVVIGPTERDALRMGQKVPWQGAHPGVVAVFSDDHLVAMAEYGPDGLLHPRLVLDGVS